jgi:hypothetical protein
MKAVKSEVVSSSKFAIVRSICALLNLGDEGKLDSFFTKVDKQLKNEITLLKKEMDTKEFISKQTLEELEDKLEDANVSLEEAYLQVDVDKIQTKEDQSIYVENYLENIDRKKTEVISLEDRIKTLKESFEKDVIKDSNEIKCLEERLKNISAL